MQIEIWDPHFHLWDVSEDTVSGHDSNQLFAPNENPVYTRDLYEKDILSAGTNYKHSGGVLGMIQISFLHQMKIQFIHVIYMRRIFYPLAPSINIVEVS